MGIPIYLFSNTFYSDFHEICIPKDELLADVIRDYVRSKQIVEHEYDLLTLFAKRYNDATIVGANFYAYAIPNLQQHKKVARAGGTPTQALLAFAVPNGQSIYLDEDIIGNIFKRIVSIKFDGQTIWKSDKKTPILHKELHVKVDSTLPQIKTFKCHARSIGEAFAYINPAFTMVTAGKKKEIIITVKHDKFTGFKICTPKVSIL